MTYGYHENYFLVDLGRAEPMRVALRRETLRQCIGGVGLGVEILMGNSRAGFEPLAPEAPLTFVTSPLVGTPLTTSAKFVIVAKSPLTGRICDAMCSSHFALALKKAGTDALCVTGRAAAFSVLFIDGSGDGPPVIELADASPWRGHSASATEAGIHERFGRDWKVVATGLAGERAIPFATLSHDGRHAGRGGLGAVLGSKNLKAIAIRGDKIAKLHNPAHTVAIAKDISERSFEPATAKYRELGTVANLLVFNRFGALPTRNFRSGTFEQAANLAEHDLAPARKIARASCAVCTIGCEHIYELKPGRRESHGEPENASKPAGVRLEYESLFALGPLCGIDQPEIVLRAAAMCDEYGLDTISMGSTAAFLMQCADQGLISDTIGPAAHRLQFGAGEALLALIEETVSKTAGPAGKLARLGSRAAAERIGQGSLRFASQVKGMEMPGYHPGTLHAMALGMAVGSRGADHNRTGAYEVDFAGTPEDVSAIAKAVVDKENRSILMDSLILCKFLRGIFGDLYAEAAEMLNAVTGFEYEPHELEHLAAGIVDARKRFNMREGWTRAEDTLPEAMFASKERETPVRSENSAPPPLTREKLDALVSAYYSAREWTAGGIPTAID